jgi:hypothetical protein
VLVHAAANSHHDVVDPPSSYRAPSSAAASSSSLRCPACDATFHRDTEIGIHANSRRHREMTAAYERGCRHGAAIVHELLAEAIATAPPLVATFTPLPPLTDADRARIGRGDPHDIRVSITETYRSDAHQQRWHAHRQTQHDVDIEKLCHAIRTNTLDRYQRQRANRDELFAEPPHHAYDPQYETTPPNEDEYESEFDDAYCEYDEGDPNEQYE